MKNSFFVLAITGPAGSGKSTVASKIAKEIEQCVNIDADDVKHFIVNGFIYDKSPTGIKQWELLGINIGSLARNFHEAGYSVIINGYINESAWEQITKHVELSHKVLLLPHLDTVKSRDKGRQEEFVMGDEAVTVHHDYFSSSNFYRDFVALDTSNHSVEQTTDEIKKMLGR